ADPDWGANAAILSIVFFALLALAGRSWLLTKLAATSAVDCWSDVSSASGRIRDFDDSADESFFEPDFVQDA
ncbi:MAG: hypothetical protein HQ518_17625, partial [Rhodopirellula sp.]|nr:hypothetical protein [Rhodopirellula sp.]